MRPHSLIRSARTRRDALASVLALSFGLGIAACAGPTPRPPASGAGTTAIAVADPLAPLRALCGQAYAGRVVADTPASADDPFAGKSLVMHVRDCRSGEIRIPFQVGEDRSRTWVIDVLADGRLRLKHDHRHRDGSADALTRYGGEQRAGTPAGRYEFPVDAESQALFRRLGREVSLGNVWALEVAPQRFVYELARPGRLFRVEFDLSAPVAAPPPPWGG
ncbi:hypothetical protein [Lysobacter antibioticus]|uniref:hypothetical protein n=1 Tax=Lysobacter antibioticus TaxID=84531 RepID=UPI000345DA5B|nr:hypothetical protein [Lysobacter antibioticus]